MATKGKSEAQGPEEAKDIEEEKYPLLEASRKILLAAVGAVALAQDEIEDFIDRLVERGEIAEKDGKKLVREMIDRRKKTREGFKEETSKRVQEALNRMSVPSKKDIDELNEKISILTRKIEELKSK